MKIRLAALITLVAPWAVLAQVSESPEPEEDPAYESMRVIANAIQLIRQDYFDEEKIDYKGLAYNALRGMLSELDPHSQFLDPEAFRGMQEDTRSEFGGLGIQVAIRNGFLTIISPMEGTPGFEAGLLPGDQILKINELATDRLTLPEAIDLLRGEVGETVTLTIQRNGGEPQDYNIERAIIKVPSVRQAELLPEERAGGRRIGYVRLTQFSEPTAKELSEALDRLEEEHEIEGLVLDLRYNPGGLLGSAIDVCGQFLPPGTPVVATESRSPGRTFSTSNRESPNRSYPLAILINSTSASGSEIVAGALKDLNRAILVGETTFGKGSVQSVIALADGSAIRLTTAKYLTPSKTPIHEQGVSPHIRSVLTRAQERALLQARRSNETPESLREQGDARPVPDPQLDRAVDALRGVLEYRLRLASKEAGERDS